MAHSTLGAAACKPSESDCTSDGAPDRYAIPSYWTAPPHTEEDGFALVNVHDGSDEWKYLSAMLETRTDWLGVGRDQAKGVCSRLVLASAWRIENCGLWFSYQDGKRHIKRDLQQLKKAAVPICKQTDSAELTRLRRAARMLHGNRDAEEGEELLLHGLNPANLLAIGYVYSEWKVMYSL